MCLILYPLIFQFDLVCSNEWKSPFTSTIYLFGLLVGALLTGPLADRYLNHEIIQLHEAAAGLRSLK